MALVITEVGMDKQFIAVMPNMIEPLNSMGITTADHTLYLTVTPEGGLRVSVALPLAPAGRLAGAGVPG